MPFLTMSGGNRIFYTDEGEGPAALLIHGWCCDGNDWAWLASDLASDFRVISIDNRGHARSSALSPYTPHTFAQDAAEVIAELELGAPLVVGHSMGAVIASTLAVERPEVVSRLALIDPVYGMDDAMVAAMMPALHHDPHAFAIRYFDQFYGQHTPAWLPIWHRRRLLATDPEVADKALTGLFQGPGAVGCKSVGEAMLGGRRAPTLTVYAESGAERADWDRALPHGPEDDIRVWPEHGHFLHQEAPERFSGALRDWLSQLDRESQPELGE